MDGLPTGILFNIMPTYSYFCSECNTDFELFFHIKDYTDNPQCIGCGKKETHRLYCKDVSTQMASVKKSDSELKTIGDLANRNRDRLSSDEKTSLYEKHNSYKEQKEEASLPTGMSRMKKGVKTIWPT
jgi:putative FmdB family regulatory protein